MSPAGVPEFPAEPPAHPPYSSAAGLPSPPDLASTPAPVPATGTRRGSTARHVLRRIIVLVVVAGVITVIGRVVRSDDSSAKLDKLVVGDCINTPTGTKFTSIKAIDCSAPHTGEIYALGDVTTKIDVTKDASNDPEVIRICRTEVPPTVGAAVAAAQATDGAAESFFVDSSAKGRLVCVITTAPRTGSFIAPVS